MQSASEQLRVVARYMHSLGYVKLSDKILEEAAILDETAPPRALTAEGRLVSMPTEESAQAIPFGTEESRLEVGSAPHPQTNMRRSDAVSTRKVEMPEIVKSTSFGKAKRIQLDVQESGAVYFRLDPSDAGTLLAASTLYKLADAFVDAAELSESIAASRGL